MDRFRYDKDAVWEGAQGFIILSGKAISAGLGGA